MYFSHCIPFSSAQCNKIHHWNFSSSICLAFVIVNKLFFTHSPLYSFLYFANDDIWTSHRPILFTIIISSIQGFNGVREMSYKYNLFRVVNDEEDVIDDIEGVEISKIELMMT